MVRPLLTTSVLPLLAWNVPLLVALLPLPGLTTRLVLWLARMIPLLIRFNWPSPSWPEPSIVWLAPLVIVDAGELVVLKMKFSGLFDIASVPLPLRVTSPLIWISVTLPAEFMARVPLLVIVPSRMVFVAFCTFTVLPPLMVTLVSVLPPTFITPPFWVVSVLSLTVPVMFTVEFVRRTIVTRRKDGPAQAGGAGVVAPLKVERAAIGGLEGAGVGHAVAAAGTDRQGRALVGVDEARVVQVQLARRPVAGALDRVAGAVGQSKDGSRALLVLKMKFSALFDIASVPPPLSVTLPVIWISVTLPAEFMARVPLLVIVPAPSKVFAAFCTFTVLPELMVTLVSVLPPAFIRHCCRNSSACRR